MSTKQYILPVGAREGGDGASSRLLYVSHAQYSQEWYSALHTHPCAELFFILGGSGTFQARQTAFPVAPGDLVAVNANVPHTETSQAGSPMEYAVLGVEGLETLADLGGCVCLHLREEREDVQSCLQLMLREARGGRSGWGRVCQSLWEAVLQWLLRREDFALSASAPPPAGPRSSWACGMARQYMDDHFKENVTLDQLAALVHVNKYHLAHVFRQEVGVSPISYLIARRIRESRFLLRETDHSLFQIAQILGFSSQSYFSQSFRRQEGISPTEYRRRYRQSGGEP